MLNIQINTQNVSIYNLGKVWYVCFKTDSAVSVLCCVSCQVIHTFYLNWTLRRFKTTRLFTLILKYHLMLKKADPPLLCRTTHYWQFDITVHLMHWGQLKFSDYHAKTAYHLKFKYILLSKAHTDCMKAVQSSLCLAHMHIVCFMGYVQSILHQQLLKIYTELCSINK